MKKHFVVYDGSIYGYFDTKQESLDYIKDYVTNRNGSIREMLDKKEDGYYFSCIGGFTFWMKSFEIDVPEKTNKQYLLFKWWEKNNDGELDIEPLDLELVESFDEEDEAYKKLKELNEINYKENARYYGYNSDYAAIVEYKEITKEIEENEEIDKSETENRAELEKSIIEKMDKKQQLEKDIVQLEDKSKNHSY